MIRLTMTNRFKIGTIFCLIIVIFSGAFSIFHIHYLNTMLSENFNREHLQFESLTSVNSNIINLKNKLNGGFNNDPQEYINSIELFKAISKDIRNHYETFSNLKNKSEPIINEISQLITRLSPQKLDTSENVSFNETLSLVEQLYNIILDAEQEALTQTTLLSDSIQSLGKKFQARIAFLTVLFIVGSLILLYFFSYQISLPIKRIKEIIRRIQDGDYSVVSRTKGNDEIAIIISALSSMTEHIRIRDQLKIEKIQLEQLRFNSLADFMNVPLILVNSNSQIAFANDEFFNFFRLVWDDIYESELGKSTLPIELKELLLEYISTENWVENEPCDIIGENYAYELHITLIPVKGKDNSRLSVIILLGKVDCSRYPPLDQVSKNKISKK